MLSLSAAIPIAQSFGFVHVELNLKVAQRGWIQAQNSHSLLFLVVGGYLFIKYTKIGYLLLTPLSQNILKVPALNKFHKELCKFHDSEQFLQKPGGQPAGRAGQFRPSKSLFFFFGQPVPDIPQFVVLFGLNTRVYFHGSSDHKQSALAQVVAAPFVAGFVGKFLSEMLENCLVERVLVGLGRVNGLADVETGCLEGGLEVVHGHLTGGHVDYWLLLGYDGGEGGEDAVEGRSSAFVGVGYNLLGSCGLLVRGVEIFLFKGLLFDSCHFLPPSFLQFYYFFNLLSQGIRLGSYCPLSPPHLSELGFCNIPIALVGRLALLFFYLLRLCNILVCSNLFRVHLRDCVGNGTVEGVCACAAVLFGGEGLEEGLGSDAVPGFKYHDFFDLLLDVHSGNSDLVLAVLPNYLVILVNSSLQFYLSLASSGVC